MTPTQADLADPALAAAVEFARSAAAEEAGADDVGVHVDVSVEDVTSATHLFEAGKPGYAGWRWAVTVSSSGPGTEVTVSEVVLQPGPDALVAPDWVPWQDRIQAGDLGVGDLMPPAPDDDRLVPGYAGSDDPAVEETAMELGLGRERVMTRDARLDAASRWLDSEFGPRSDMARGAPAHCGTCGFYLPLAGSLRAAFGTCGNEISPADGHVVHAEYGCGAHSEAEVEQVSPVLVADLIYDDALLDVAPLEPEPATDEASTDADDAAAPEELPADAVVADEPAVAEESLAVSAELPADTVVADEPAVAEDSVAEPAEESAVAAPTESAAEPSVVADPAADESAAVADSVVAAPEESAAEAVQDTEPAAAAQVDEAVATELGVEPAAETEAAPATGDAEPEPEPSATAGQTSTVDTPARWAAARPWGYVPTGERTDPPGE